MEGTNIPQINTNPKPTKPVIDAMVPGVNPASTIRNISPADKQKYLDDAELASMDRADRVAKETAMPTVPSKILKFEIRKFGKHWQAYAPEGKGLKALLPAPSLLISALDAMADEMYNQGFKA